MKLHFRGLLLWGGLLIAVLVAAGAARAQVPEWTVNAAEFESNMNVTGALYISGVRSVDPQNLVAAFVDGQVRGVASRILIGGTAVYFLTVYADVNAGEITFKAFEAATARVIDVDGTLSFEANAVEGTVSTPFVWEAASATLPDLPSTPRLLAPDDGTSGLTGGVSMQWLKAPSAASYHVQVATSQAFDAPVVDERGLGPPELTSFALERGTVYFWRVRAENSGGSGPWSVVRRFATLAAPPAIPTLEAPSDGEYGLSTNPALSWAASAGAARYDVQISMRADFSGPTYGATRLEAARFTPSRLSHGVTYYWRVRAGNEGGASAWSQHRSFTTIVAAPLPSEPAQNATGISVRTDFEWSAVDAADHYTLVYARDRHFAEERRAVPGLGSSTYAPTTPLNPGTVYYWKVSATGRGGVGPYSEVFSFQTGPSGEPPAAAPAAPGLLEPAIGSLVTSESPVLRWMPVTAAAVYDVQVANDPTFNAGRDETNGLVGVTFEASGLSAGATYFWRVRARDMGGPGPWSTGAYFHTPIPPPTIPDLIGPADEEEGISTSPMLRWREVTSAEFYQVQISSVRGFASVDLDRTEVDGTTVQAGGLIQGQLYYWRVRAFNDGGAGAWSLPGSFRTFEVATAEETVSHGNPPPIEIPQASVLVDFSELDSDAILHVARVTSSLESPVAGYVSAAPGFWRIEQLGAESFVAEVCFPLSALQAVIEPAAVRIFKRADVDSPWLILSTSLHSTNGVCAHDVSSFSEFALVQMAAPTAPVILPSTAEYRPVRWNPVSGATQYRIQVSEFAHFASLAREEEGVLDTSVSIDGLKHATTYHWRVQASNGFGSGAWSTVGSFITAADVPAAPALSSPEDGAAGMSGSLTVAWIGAGAGVQYDLQVASDAAFSEPVAAPTRLALPVYTITGLREGTTYYWRVRATNAGGTGSWSQARQFVTESANLALPAVPDLTRPADGVLDQSVNPLLTWKPAAGALAYEVQVSQFGQILGSWTGIRNSELELADLAHANTYFWRVRAENGAGHSDWSPVYRFETAVPAPTNPPETLAPVDGEAAGIRPVLTWKSVPRATRYHLQIAELPDFAESLVVEADEVRSTSYDIEDGILLPVANYYWRVRGVNGSGPGPWSPVPRFVSPSAPPGLPLLSDPADEASVLGPTQTLLWHPAERATSYDVQLAGDSLFAAPIVEVTGQTATWYRLPNVVAGPTYFWRVRGVGSGGTGEWSDAFRFTRGTATASEVTDLPQSLDLAPNFPNPFNPATTIPYALPSARHVRLIIYDALGREVRRLVDGMQPAGRHSVIFEASGLPSGMYVCRLTAGDQTHSRSLMLLK